MEHDNDTIKTKIIIWQVKQEQLGMGSDRGEYYSTTATISFFQKVGYL